MVLIASHMSQQHVGAPKCHSSICLRLQQRNKRSPFTCRCQCGAASCRGFLEAEALEVPHASSQSASAFEPSCQTHVSANFMQTISSHCLAPLCVCQPCVIADIVSRGQAAAHAAVSCKLMLCLCLLHLVRSIICCTAIAGTGTSVGAWLRSAPCMHVSSCTPCTCSAQSSIDTASSSSVLWATCSGVSAGHHVCSRLSSAQPRLFCDPHGLRPLLRCQ